MPEDLYWRSTPRELCALLEQMTKRAKAESRAAMLRAGLIAAQIVNVNLAQGATPLRPDHWIPKEPVMLSADEMKQRIVGWASGRKRADA